MYRTSTTVLSRLIGSDSTLEYDSMTHIWTRHWYSAPTDRYSSSELEVGAQASPFLRPPSSHTIAVGV